MLKVFTMLGAAANLININRNEKILS